MEQFKTVEELRAHVVAHCGVDCEGEGCEYDCVKLTTKELRNDYAARYGCICGAECERCLDFKGCFPSGKKE